MQHVLYGSKSVFIDDEATLALIDYAAHIAQVGSGDRVRLDGINAEGNTITTTFLLNPGTVLVAESTSMSSPGLDNGDAIAYMVRRTSEFSIDPGFLEPYAGDSDGAPAV